jgi:hypothetical protein
LRARCTSLATSQEMGARWLYQGQTVSLEWQSKQLARKTRLTVEGDDGYDATVGLSRPTGTSCAHTRHASPTKAATRSLLSTQHLQLSRSRAMRPPLLTAPQCPPCRSALHIVTPFIVARPIAFGLGPCKLANGQAGQSVPSISQNLVWPGPRQQGCFSASSPRFSPSGRKACIHCMPSSRTGRCAA